MNNKNGQFQRVVSYEYKNGQFEGVASNDQ